VRLGPLEIGLIFVFLVIVGLTVAAAAILFRWIVNRNKNVNRNVVNVTNVVSAGTGTGPFCVGCGERVDASWQFCPKCSTKIRASSGAPESSSG
jgi:tRNA(Ile2) C34 agmatinyltransferase TiaS